jgi:hypothetical protein
MVNETFLVILRWYQVAAVNDTVYTPGKSPPDNPNVSQELYKNTKLVALTAVKRLVRAETAADAFTAVVATNFQTIDGAN